MWNLNRQWWLRRLFLVILFLGAIYAMISLHKAGGGNLHAEVKIIFTNGEFAAQNASLKTKSMVIAALFFFLMAGFPSIAGIAVAMFIWGAVPGFLIVLFFQGLITWVILKRKIGIAALEPNIVESMKQTELTASDLSPLARFFFMLPPRTLDVMMARLIDSKKNLGGLVVLSFLGMAFRLGLESFWYLCFLNLLIDFRAFPHRDMASFLIASALAIFACLWPKIPEMIPGKPGLAAFCQTWTGERSGTAPGQGAIPPTPAAPVSARG